MVKNASRRTFVVALCSAVFACGLAVAPLAFAETAATGDKASAAQTGETCEFTDSLGRTVEIPAEITAIASSGFLPQQVLLMVAPEKMACLASSLTDSQAHFFGEQYAGLEAVGAIFGAKGDFNRETVSASGAQIVIDVGDTKEGMAEALDAPQEQLGIPCYDSELIQKVAEESGFAENYVKEAGEYTPGGFLSSALSNRAFGPTNEDILWEIQCRVISELAEKGPCVIVGRCADYILQDKAKCLKVFIHADMAFRAKRIVEVYGEREQSPEQRLRDKDKRRAAYHRFYTNMKWGYAQNYHITLDSGELGIDKCADIIADLYKSKA